MDAAGVRADRRLSLAAGAAMAAVLIAAALLAFAPIRNGDR
jgi:hypothetical protein